MGAEVGLEVAEGGFILLLVFAGEEHLGAEDVVQGDDADDAAGRAGLIEHAL